MSNVIDYKPYMESGLKACVSVIEIRYKDGKVSPLYFIWENGIRYKVDKILEVRQAASIKAGGAGMRYKIRAKDRETYLFLEETTNGAKWFMERRLLNSP